MLDGNPNQIFLSHCFFLVVLQKIQGYKLHLIQKKKKKVYKLHLIEAINYKCTNLFYLPQNINFLSYVPSLARPHLLINHDEQKDLSWQMKHGHGI